MKKILIFYLILLSIKRYLEGFSLLSVFITGVIAPVIFYFNAYNILLLAISNSFSILFLPLKSINFDFLSWEKHPYRDRVELKDGKFITDPVININTGNVKTKNDLQHELAVAMLTAEEMCGIGARSSTIKTDIPESIQETKMITKISKEQALLEKVTEKDPFLEDLDPSIFDV